MQAAFAMRLSLVHVYEFFFRADASLWHETKWEAISFPPHQGLRSSTNTRGCAIGKTTINFPNLLVQKALALIESKEITVWQVRNPDGSGETLQLHS
jgi:hypothetical protein